jgi:mycothiol S-conjugate amidase
MTERLRELGQRSFWEPPEDATPEQITEFEAYSAKMLVPDEAITTWIDIDGAPLEAKWAAIHEHVTQISNDNPFMLLGLDGWRDGWGREAYILRESRIESALPETDLLAGIV